MDRPAGESRALLACDWGSTRLRAWRLAWDGTVEAAADFPFGAGRLAPGEAAARFSDTVRPALQAEDLPALLCGAIGSNIGWRTAPYVDCPAGLDDLAARLLQVEPMTWIAPGLRWTAGDGACDVLRGEETLALGWVLLDTGRAQGRRLICQPGTHSKWLLVEDGRVVRFQSAFTGELYAVLGAHSILRHSGPTGDLASFDAGLAAAADGDALINRIYSARSRVAGAGASQDSTGDFLSGLLIGAECASTRRLVGEPQTAVELVGDAPLCDLYDRALARLGVAVTRHEGEPAVRAGLLALAKIGHLP